MLRENKWLIDLWKREWSRCRKDWIRQVSIEILCVFAVCVLYILKRAKLESFVTYMLNMPEAVYAFWGLSPDAAAGKAAFYIQWILMPLHIEIAWWICDHTLRSVRVEEEQGSVFYLCNQWYGRSQIALAKYLWNVLYFILNYAILFVLCAVLAGSGWSLTALAGLFLKGILVMTMLLSTSYCYAVVSERGNGFLWADVLVFGTLAIGNLYKLRDLVILLLQRSGRSYAGIYRMLGWLDGLRWLSPLSWLNPYHTFGTAATVVQVMICLVLTAGAACFGLLGYRIRRFE